MGKKGLYVWFFTTITFVSLIHLVDAISIVFLHFQSHLLQEYPFIGATLATIPATTYLTVTAITTLVFWGATCAVAFDSPVEQFLKKVLSEAKKQSAVEEQTLADRSELLDAMYETLEATNHTLTHVVDIINNVKTEVKSILPVSNAVDNIRTEVSSLKREIKRIDKKGKLPVACKTCGKKLSPRLQALSILWRNSAAPKRNGCC